VVHDAAKMRIAAMVKLRRMKDFRFIGLVFDYEGKLRNFSQRFSEFSTKITEY
jgi:hypothetical protein